MYIKWVKKKKEEEGKEFTYPPISNHPDLAMFLEILKAKAKTLLRLGAAFEVHLRKPMDISTQIACREGAEARKGSRKV